MLKTSILSIILLFTLVFGTEVLAQDGQTGVGLRLGVSNGLTVRHFISDNAAVEGILHSRWKGLVITGLYEVHQRIPDLEGLHWFYGGGAHIGTWNGNRGRPDWQYSHSGHTVFGLDGIIGMDYYFAEAPINLSLDYKPAFNLSSGAGFWGDELALSIRFMF